MKTKITELLGIEYPIVQGAMAWIAEDHLAAAVSKAGGLGIIAGGAAPVDYIREEIHKARAITDKPLGMNIMLLSPNADDLAQLAIDEKIEVLTTGAGNPGKYIADWKNAGIKVMPVVASVALAKRMERAGADAVIAEGMEGGGHITGWFIPQGKDTDAIESGLEALCDCETFNAKYGCTDAQARLPYAVGDGNHSMATAKAYWEEVKKGLTPEEQENHPARFALAEIVNIHDESIIIEPIHRALFGIDGEELLKSLTAFYEAQGCKAYVADNAPETEGAHF